jgi:hypothetical protein
MYKLRGNKNGTTLRFLLRKQNMFLFVDSNAFMEVKLTELG